MPPLAVWEFWQARREGMPTALAARRAGFSSRLGYRLVAKHGGVIPRVARPSVVDEQGPGPQSRYLSAQERDLVAHKTAAGLGVREIARDLQRSPSTISRELRRNRAVHRPYGAAYAHRSAQRRRARPKLRKLEDNDRLRAYVWDKLSVTSTGRRNRSALGWCVISRRMRACASVMKRSIRLCMCSRVGR